MAVATEPGDKLEGAARQLLQMLPGYNEKDEHIKDTPVRVASMWRELLTPTKEFMTTFENRERYDQIVLANGVKFYSVCAHHLLVFFGEASVAYLPRHRYVGLSKLARIVHHFGHALQIQERLTQQIGDYCFDTLDPNGVAVVIRARHLCLEARGVQAPGTETTTSYLKGAFRDNPVARAELMQLISNKNGL
jgi:GTP cyclohydrolase I